MRLHIKTMCKPYVTFTYCFYTKPNDETDYSCIACPCECILNCHCSLYCIYLQIMFNVLVLNLIPPGLFVNTPLIFISTIRDLRFSQQ
jgi:hypothetical protein